MLILDGANDLVRVTTGSAADVEVHASYVDATSADPPVIKGTVAWRTNTASITTATTTTVVAAPGAGVKRNVKHLNCYNNHGATSTTVVIDHTDGTNAESLWEGTLLAGESIVLDATGRWTQYDASGLVKLAAYPVATQAEMEAGSSIITFVTPGRQHYHPSACKCWVEGTANSTVILASYNITSLADTATGAQTVTIATDFSSASWCCNVTRSEDDLTLVYSSTYDAKTAGTVIMRSAVEAGSGSDPTSASGNASWSMTGFGDHA